MKKLILTIAVILSAFAVTTAQKYAFVDSDYILTNIPEYQDALDILDEFSIQWQKEIEGKFTEVDQLYKDYQAEAVLLPEDMKAQRENEIIKKEKEAKDLQKQRFGREGDLFQKRQELVQPIQEKIYNAIEEIAETQNYALVFDKAGSLSILYAKAKYDISDDVLDEVGTVMQTVRREDRQGPAPSSGSSSGNSNNANKMIEQHQGGNQSSSPQGGKR
ncbi:MAG: OmpH family outer membrane protein [Bacteroidetes bacterium]|nr:MAG: OmpH family outer membrane protein [Bacteroidota bacterium]RLD80950.1 MAG: OmpH family outer membrane protein [Bacteroidota bacterium]